VSLCPNEANWKTLLLENAVISSISMLVIIKDLRTLYAPHLLYSSEAVYKEPEVINESEPEAVDNSQSQKLLMSQIQSLQSLSSQTLLMSQN